MTKHTYSVVTAVVLLFLAPVILAMQQTPAPTPQGASPQAPPAGGRRGGGGGFVTPVYDSVPPQLPDLKSPALLIFSKTNGYREEPAIKASNDALVSIANKRGWSSFVTENAAVMNPAQLKRFAVVIWNNTSGDVLTEDQRTAFKTWLENGGSVVGTHGTGGDPSYVWDWYPQTFIGAQFTSHSSQQIGTVRIEDTKSPITKGLPAVWVRTVPDEWYAFKENPRAKGAHILATADETTYNPGRSTMGADHPMVWTHCVGKGKVFYSAIGHSAATYQEPLHLQLLENAIAWALGPLGPDGGAACSARPAQGPPASGAAAADRKDWIQIFNGRNLDGWVPKIKGYNLGENFGDTFRVEDGVLKVSYDKYTSFDNKFGHLFYRQKFSYYIVAAEYRFVGDQVPGGPAWALRNNGLMLHSQAPETMGKDQDFPISIEAQLLGGGPSGERSTLNVCTPGTEIVMNGAMVKGHCTNSTSETYRGDRWVRVEVEVRGSEHVKHMVEGRTVLEYDSPQIGGGSVSGFDPAVKVDGKLLTEGYITIQGESHPTEFRKIEVLNLSGCMQPKASNYKSYYVHRDDSTCK